MLVVKMATMVVVPALQTEMAVVRQTSALAEMPSKTVSSLPVVVVVPVLLAQVVTVVLGKLVPMVQQVWRVSAKDATRMQVLAAMARVLVVVTVAALLVGSPVVEVAPE